MIDQEPLLLLPVIIEIENIVLQAKFHMMRFTDVHQMMAENEKLRIPNSIALCIT